MTVMIAIATMPRTIATAWRLTKFSGRHRLLEAVCVAE